MAGHINPSRASPSGVLCWRQALPVDTSDRSKGSKVDCSKISPRCSRQTCVFIVALLETHTDVVVQTCHRATETERYIMRATRAVAHHHTRQLSYVVASPYRPECAGPVWCHSRRCVALPRWTCCCCHVSDLISLECLLRSMSDLQLGMRACILSRSRT